MKKITKLLGVLALLTATASFISCENLFGDKNKGQEEEQEQKVTLVGSWKSQEFCNSANPEFNLKGYGYLYLDLNADGTFCEKISVEREEENGVSKPVNPIEYVYFKGSYSSTDTKILLTECKVSFDNTTWVDSGNTTFIYSNLTATTFTAYDEEEPEGVFNFKRVN